MTSIKLYEGNCLDVLRKCPDNYMDSIVTDPPYGLSFMSKAWDYEVPSTEIWKECLRVLKPGGHLLAFGGTRTYHRLVVNIEDAGFEIRDQIMWIYGSGFPKSQNIALAIDKQLGVESEVIGENPSSRPNSKIKCNRGFDEALGDGESAGVQDLKRATSPEAQKWSGYGTALKPANEPICLARKPLSEKTVAKNVLKHGVGGLNVDASRIVANQTESGFTTEELLHAHAVGIERTPFGASVKDEYEKFLEGPSGRFPANILFGHSPNCGETCRVIWFDGESGQVESSDGTKIYIDRSVINGTAPKAGDYVTLDINPNVLNCVAGLNVTTVSSNGCVDGCPVKELDKQSLEGGMHSAGGATKRVIKTSKHSSSAEFLSSGGTDRNISRFGDTGGASRFFYVAKASKKDRGEGNTHPTVKPIKLMEYLIKLVTPEGGIVLDPFMGSGTTGVAAQNLGFGFRGVEMSPEYFQIASSRINNTAKETA